MIRFSTSEPSSRRSKSAADQFADFLQAAALVPINTVIQKPEATYYTPVLLDVVQLSITYAFRLGSNRLLVTSLSQICCMKVITEQL